ncbi:hypothetical protein GNI_058210 [Gregarina niphandrodes]|uniref:Uncharacterized protein n=1 Tax=Gregarina niphandrodes TaxID=110365 RepID=A0A023B8N8_GRENI|nr:hypothetical protein GNI_058210 [Gregarina niphandrodes]EZG69392.1 hypothetical protein GNI_058210 [Gregarina niphandrodes]|eukprot:XP_011134438.1 hypothetical protein GNI_058210 [Gregarina niphandrodes]
MRGDISKRSERAGLTVALAAFFDRHGGLSTTDGCSFYRVKVKLPEKLVQKDQEMVELIVASKWEGVGGPYFNFFKHPNKLQLAAESELNQAIDDVVMDQFVEFLCSNIVHHCNGKMDQKLQSRLEAEVAGPYALQSWEAVPVGKDHVALGDDVFMKNKVLMDESYIDDEALMDDDYADDYDFLSDDEVASHGTSVESVAELAVLKAESCSRVPKDQYWVNQRHWELNHHVSR